MAHLTRYRQNETGLPELLYMQRTTYGITNSSALLIECASTLNKSYLATCMGQSHGLLILRRSGKWNYSIITAYALLLRADETQKSKNMRIGYNM